MKRSTTMKYLSIGLISVSAFALTSCGEEETTARSFKTLSECVAATYEPDAKMTVADCNDSYKNAMATYKDTAPRYAEQKLCEEEFEKCTVEQRPDGSHSFMPFFMGYMMGRNITTGTSANYYSTSPVYRTKTGYYTSGNGYSTFKTMNAPVKIPSASFVKPVSTYKSPPMTRVSIASRGGFGAGRTSFGG